MPHLNLYAELGPIESLTDEVTRRAMLAHAAKIAAHIRSRFLAIVERHVSPDVATRIVDDIAAFVSQNAIAYSEPEIKDDPSF